MFNGSKVRGSCLGEKFIFWYLLDEENLLLQNFLNARKRS